MKILNRQIRSHCGRIARRNSTVGQKLIATASIRHGQILIGLKKIQV